VYNLPTGWTRRYNTEYYCPDHKAEV